MSKVLFDVKIPQHESAASRSLGKLSAIGAESQRSRGSGLIPMEGEPWATIRRFEEGQSVVAMSHGHG